MKIDMNKEQVIGIVRHALTFIGGVLVAKGLASDTVIMELTGSIIALIGGVWSIVVKIKSEGI
jgi:hypothetical protein|tara:strand:- start:193 stop:381 length:189 start_codon:yes stop_codon:yes gene_type:complete